MVGETTTITLRITNDNTRGDGVVNDEESASVDRDGIRNVSLRENRRRNTRDNRRNHVTVMDEVHQSLGCD
jgi:hypothetical protein